MTRQKIGFSATIVFLAALILTTTPVYAASEKNFESWLVDTWDESSRFGIFFSKPLVLRLFMKNEEWYAGKQEWRNKAGKKLACAFTATYSLAPLPFPYKYELIIFPPPPGGSTKTIESGLITEQSCTETEKAPLNLGQPKIES